MPAASLFHSRFVKTTPGKGLRKDMVDSLYDSTLLLVLYERLNFSLIGSIYKAGKKFSRQFLVMRMHRPSSPRNFNGKLTRTYYSNRYVNTSAPA